MPTKLAKQLNMNEIKDSTVSFIHVLCSRLVRCTIRIFQTPTQRTPMVDIITVDKVRWNTIIEKLYRIYNTSVKIVMEFLYTKLINRCRNLRDSLFETSAVIRDGLDWIVFLSVYNIELFTLKKKTHSNKYYKILYKIATM